MLRIVSQKSKFYAICISKGCKFLCQLADAVKVYRMAQPDKLLYFDLRARGEVIRMIYVLAGEKLTDERLSMEQWPAKKEGKTHLNNHFIKTSSVKDFAFHFNFTYITYHGQVHTTKLPHFWNFKNTSRWLMNKSTD